ncbi:Crp/Fnr family transcriptional regulator [Motilibacter aurantiacus]|uniref:Crp/Fnr family transcriptional regulator n=1 Tax=Motilibacter aurantiacus TaxID=2714955 RepID=UPI00140C0A71|nr:Crp/Fnr family transcriptional regulator [Motilibacter aurantiacus]NHC47270.1 Crp/Fnr family transcriptional regulator [Motilibacter aurantiacus]
MEWPLLASLNPQERREVLAAARTRSFARREVLFHAGDPGDTLFLIRAGHVAVRVTTEYGDTVTLAVVGPGETVGELALLGEVGERSATVMALEATEALTLTRDQIASLRATHPRVERLLLDVLTAQVRRLTGHLVEALYVPVRHRVVRRLLALAEQYGDGAKPVTLTVTQDDIAGLAGAARPTVNQVLRALESDGAVSLSRGRIEIVDRARLAKHRG